MSTGLWIGLGFLLVLFIGIGMGRAQRHQLKQAPRLKDDPYQFPAVPMAHEPELPLMDDPTMDAPPAPGLHESPAAGARTVLLVDDEELIRDLIFEILAPTTLQIECIETGTELRERLASSETPPDAVLLDLSLPDVMGDTLLDEACKRWPQTICIVCTGHISDGLDAHFKGRASAILRKPFEPDELLKLFGLQER